MRSAAIAGDERGAENDMMDSLLSSIKEIVVKDKDGFDWIDDAFIKKDDLWNSPLNVYISFNNVLGMLNQEDDLEQGYLFKFEMSEPYYGFSGWDKEAAIESIKESSISELL